MLIIPKKEFLPLSERKIDIIFHFVNTFLYVTQHIFHDEHICDPCVFAFGSYLLKKS